MRPVEPMLADVRTDYKADPATARVVLNATSWFEATLALGVLAETLSPRSLVTFANVREAIQQLPRCPLPISTDFESLARAWELEREGTAWARSFGSDEKAYSIVLIGEGNFVYDIVIRAEGRVLMLMPENTADEFLNPEVVELMMESPAILGSIVDLMQAMGLPFYPMFYMSLEDWQQEHATAVFGEVLTDFDRVQRELPASVLSTVQPAMNVPEPLSQGSETFAAAS